MLGISFAQCFDLLLPYAMKVLATKVIAKTTFAEKVLAVKLLAKTNFAEKALAAKVFTAKPLLQSPRYNNPCCKEAAKAGDRVLSV